MSNSTPYHHAGLGGTFDHLHVGHKALIDKALATAQHVSLGITTDDFTHTQTKTLTHLIEPYTKRRDELQAYIDKIGAAKRIKIFPLSDAIGPTLTDSTIDCLVCTDHTLSGMNHINQLRRDRQLSILPIVKAQLIKDATGVYISSTRIRQGLIDASGHVYLYHLPQTLVLTKSQRDQCIKPFGQIIAQSQILSLLKQSSPPFIGVVGDQSLAVFMKHQLPVDLGIYDNRIQRQDNDVIRNLVSSLSLKQVIIKVANNPGSIGLSAVKAIGQAVNQMPCLIEVDGEEDLLVIPVILAAPLQGLIFYGQPNVGLVSLTVTPELKRKVVDLINS